MREPARRRSTRSFTMHRTLPTRCSRPTIGETLRRTGSDMVLLTRHPTNYLGSRQRLPSSGAPQTRSPPRRTWSGWGRSCPTWWPAARWRWATSTTCGAPRSPVMATCTTSLLNSFQDLINQSTWQTKSYWIHGCHVNEAIKENKKYVMRNYFALSHYNYSIK